jgi:soluble lytic murein transglycosylase-like protein
LVLFRHGRVLKVDSFRAEGERALLELSGGGSLIVPLVTIERVVDDEVGPAGEPPEPQSMEAILADMETVPETPYGDLIHRVGRRHGVSPRLIAAVARVESAFDPRAVSSKGARGLMQLMPATALRFGLELEQIFQPEKNLEAGVRYLKWLTERFSGNLSLVLAAYNAGEGTVDRYGGLPPFRETHSYVVKVYEALGVGEPGRGR